MKTKMILYRLAALMLPLFFTGCAENTEQSGNQITKIQGVIQQDTLSSWVDVCDTCGACNNTDRWSGTEAGGGKEVSLADARERVISLHHDFPDLPMGGFISKQALDSIFCHRSDYNGIYCYIGKGDDGKPTMIIEGWHDLNAATGRSRVDVAFDPSLPTSDRFRTFITQTMCPTVCGSCGD